MLIWNLPKSSCWLGTCLLVSHHAFLEPAHSHSMCTASVPTADYDTPCWHWRLIATRHQCRGHLCLAGPLFCLLCKFEHPGRTRVFRAVRWQVYAFGHLSFGMYPKVSCINKLCFWSLWHCVHEQGLQNVDLFFLRYGTQSGVFRQLRIWVKTIRKHFNFGGMWKYLAQHASICIIVLCEWIIILWSQK